MLGSTAALTLNNHRLARLVITLEGASLQIERTARNGQVFTDTTTQEDARAAMNRLGVNIYISDHNGSQADVASPDFSVRRDEGAVPQRVRIPPGNCRSSR